MKSIPGPILKFLILSVAFLVPSNLYGQAEIEFEIGEDFYFIQFNEGEGTPLKDLIILCKDITEYPIQFWELEVEDPKVFIIGKQKVRKTKQAFFEYFQSVLVSYDFICAPYGPEDDPFFITIRKMTAGAGPRGGGSDLFRSQIPVVALEDLEKYKDNPGRLITITVKLKYIEARQTMTSLTPYFPNQQLEALRPVEQANSLIITGFANKVYFTHKLITLMDVPPTEIEAEFLKRELEYAVAEELEPILSQLLSVSQGVRPGGAPAQQRTQGTVSEPEPKILADPRTNSLLITGSEKMVVRIQEWVDVLDIEVDPRGDIHVYRLKNTLAGDMVQVLEEMLRGQQQAGTGRRPPGTSGASTVSSTGIEAPAQVVADEASNSLVITASKTKYAELLEVIKRLDIRRRQVLIEAAIVELTGTLDETLGVELAGLDLKNADTADPDYHRPFGFTSFGLSILEFDPANPQEAQRVPVVDTGLTGGIFHGEDFAIPFILSALSQDEQTNILSLPSILTNDNEEAIIEALDKEPTASFQAFEGGGGGTSQTFDGYQEAGITLRISPSISAGNYLKLQVAIKVSDFGTAVDPQLPPPQTERTVETSVTIPDGHTMIIGGVLTDDSKEAADKIPYLGDLPLLGFLFRSTSKNKRKVNLYVFITPHIIGDDFANLDDISYRKKKEVEALKGNVLLFDPDFEKTNVDTQVIDAGANWIFEIPAYAEPDTGETPGAYIQSTKDDQDWGDGEGGT